MSDQGERTCPLCAEEMDLTDQQLKPCKCGYEICVWCWHQIMDLAEKDESEGRCPACRSLYDKEKIVATAENCGRLVAEINIERKIKSQKGKTNKLSDGRKQLSTVRVIQRNLVYVVGLPLNLADEDLLGRKEYFAQYGKVLKVSMSRTAAGVIQQFPNNTCSVYITYSKEEEAIRCIQSVHGFVLEGRSLKACFGTTKYCHAWLRNMPCNNPDCLYLHEIGSHEDSFSKDEIVSAYTRVQQITGATTTMQQRSGNMLPPPTDDFYINSSTSEGKPLMKNTSNNFASIDKDFPPSNSGRSTALPAGTSWGVWGTNCQPPVTSAASSNGHYKQNPDTVSGNLAVSSTPQISTVHSDAGKKLIMTEGDTVQARGKVNKLDSLKQHVSMEPQSTKVTVDANPSKAGVPLENDDVGVGMPAKIINSVDDIRQFFDSGLGIDHGVTINGKSLCTDISSLSIGMNPRDEQPGVAKCNEITQQYYTRPNGDLIPFTAATTVNDVHVSNEQLDWRLNSQTQMVANASSEVEDDLQSFNDQRLKDPEVVSRSSYMPNSGDSSHMSNHSREHSLGYSEAYRETDFNAPLFGQWNAHESSLSHSFGTAVVPNGYSGNIKSSSNSLDRAIERPYLPFDEGKGRQMGRFQNNPTASFGNGATIDKGESSIISNILSMDFDVWDDPITSPQNLSQLFGESDKLHGSSKQSSSWKVQHSNQSRFSFAREGESITQELDTGSSLNVGRVVKNHSFTQDFENKVPYLNRLGNGNSFSSNDIAEYNNISGRQCAIPSNKLSVSRPPVLAPPGFSLPNRAPPPGFSSHERTDQTYEALSGGQFLNNSSLLRNSYQALPTINNNFSTGDIEFIDPAIMAVGKGRVSGGLNSPGIDLRSSFSSQYGAFESEARRQMLMQRSVPQHQNLRYTDTGNGFSTSNDDGYALHSRHMEQTHASTLSPFSQLSLQNSRNSQMSNSQWNGWSDVQGANNNINMADLRNERLGYNHQFYNGYEDSNFHMPSSSDRYNNNRTFGM